METWEKQFSSDKGMYKDRSDTFVVYDLNQKELKSVTDKWFQYDYQKAKTGEIYVDSFITVKKCTPATVNSLYGYVHNCVLLAIHCPTGAKFKKNDKGDLLYDMIAKIDSIDDSSYTIWFKEIPLKALTFIREKLMKYIDSKEWIDGAEFLHECQVNGANPETINYD